MKQEKRGPLASGEICTTASLVDDLFPQILYYTTISLIKSLRHTLLQDEESMHHHMVMPTVLLIQTDTMNLQADSAIFILNSVMDWDFDHFLD